MVRPPSKIEGMPTTCKGCGRDFIYRRAQGSSFERCNTCWQAARRAQRVEEIYEYYGSEKCEICGYDRCRRALTFHHVDPTTKEFQIAGSETRAWHKVQAEIDKCVLLCSNCHEEVHAGLHPPLQARGAIG